ncbi:MAG TPA: protein kinase, partial [Burkholderiales bacterium]|nr:protein kinase [Burkholderiales bacterium]
MRFLIVDDSREHRKMLAAMLRARWPSSQTEEWDPRAQGSPRAELELGRYDAALLEWQPHGAEDLNWLAERRLDPLVPRIVLIADRGSEQLAVEASELGAAQVLRRNELTLARLVHSVEQALRERPGELAGPLQAAAGPAGTRALGAAPARTPAPLINRYRILGIIGQGGMALVYLAERESDGLRLVLKVLDPALRTDTTYVRRLEREYKLIASIHNEHVARIYDQDFSGEHPYIAMEFFSGGSLATRMHEGLTSRDALRIMSQIARALDAVHAHGIVHRDLKPQNILFRENGLPAIVDFGLARSLAMDVTLTRHGQLLATPRYASPEQCLGRPADHRSDLYSLGVIFYEMLSGR